jgi:uncharacterized C2H2 Zn-finger protein
MVHTKVTPRKTKEVQLMASCKLCSRDFSNEEQLKTHLLQCVKEMTQFTCEVCSQVFKKKEYMKRHMNNIHGQVSNTGPKVVEVNKKDEGSDKESSDEDSQVDDDIEKYNPGCVPLCFLKKK